MTYTLNLSENEIKDILANHVGNCTRSDVFFHVSEEDFYRGHVVSASISLRIPPDISKKEVDTK